MTSHKPYRGVNVLTLMFAALSADLPSNWWLTYHQAQALGGHVNRGEHGLPVVFYQRTPAITETRAGAQDDELLVTTTQWRPVLKVYTVFNVAQCAGITAPEPQPLPWQPVEAAERITEAADIPIRYQGAAAFYQPQADQITMPPRPFFPTVMGFYETLLHELIHATGHVSRLQRPFGPEGSETYAWEELIAELGSAMLSVITGVPAPDFPNIAAYVASWRQRLERDPQALGEAATTAQKAVEWLLAKAGMPLEA